VIEVERKKLIREIKREALTRMEEAARTESDFAAVEKQWDRLDENWERKQRYYGFLVETITLDWLAVKNGDFLDIIFDSAEEMHQLIEDIDISELVKMLRPKPKDVLYLSAFHFYTIQQIALVKGQSDRNILKMRTRMITKLRDDLYERLLIRITKDGIITTSQRHFLQGGKQI
jgi:hypothetical protein